MATPVSRETLDQLLIPSTATLTSVLRGLGITHSFMHGVRPLKPDMKVAGPAYTLRYIPAREDLDQAPLDNLKDKQRVGIEEIAAGQVLVIDARGDTRAGTMGAILATRIHCRGAVGVVTDGAYRDSPVIAESGLAAYSAAMNAHTNKTIHHPSEVQVPIACGEVAVIPGDIIVGDAEGVVVVPSQLADEVARRAAEMEEKEEFILERIRGGASIIGTYPADEETLAEYEEWKRRRR
ncbi:ribonuclease activity regulator RraA [Candidatus Poribacteria bacterium]|jgi:regulator of RNase E activity RraA|nr:ribonuclease activity regulator RraA [Candidatus Poribacteria bacterium]MBT5534613.1 ribonuclease activity regulator RraA [Candidatus Poribacteria bacterium]MBT5710205.1 ribonuclease activity regulator RraA [Candidatus Poribacteria bacterium]MBT7098666.1 ribonuclease activity regulator RraA [Candidatus Poribacteria bacterium]MBT7806816.1 ribonuclease activity regulator RraA [Candidatus Poribacteria bacterium]